jgi:hypothetical protein
MKVTSKPATQLLPLLDAIDYRDALLHRREVLRRLLRHLSDNYTRHNCEPAKQKVHIEGSLLAPRPDVVGDISRDLLGILEATNGELKTLESRIAVPSEQIDVRDS